MVRREQRQLPIFIVFTLILAGVIALNSVTQSAQSYIVSASLLHPVRELVLAAAILSFTWSYYKKKHITTLSIQKRQRIYILTGIILVLLMTTIIFIHAVETNFYAGYVG
jgi:hypothetical protein